MSAARPSRRQRPPSAVIAVLAASGICSSLTQTLLIPIIGDLPRLLDSSAADASWAITATLLAGAVANPIMGRIGDTYGKRRVLMLLLGLLFVGSVTCALSTSLGPMLIGRTLQGISSAAVPLGMAILRETVPIERIFGAMALISATMGIGSAVGLPLAAVTAQVTDWHVLFWLSAVLALILLVSVKLVIPETGNGEIARFDVTGTIVLAASLLLLLIPLSKLTDWGWSSPVVWALLSAAAIVGAGWAASQLKTAHPLIDLRLLRRRTMLFTNIASLLSGFAMFASFFVVPQVLQMPDGAGFGFGLDLSVAGIALMPAGIAMLLIAPVAGRLTRRSGPRFTLVLGMLVVAAGYGIYAVSLNILLLFLSGSLIIGVGIGLSFGAVPALIMSSVPARHGGVANGVNALVRSIGSSLGTAVTAAALLTATITIDGAGYPSEQAFRLAILIGAAGALVSALVASFAQSGASPETTL